MNLTVHLGMYCTEGWGIPELDTCKADSPAILLHLPLRLIDIVEGMSIVWRRSHNLRPRIGFQHKYSNHPQTTNPRKSQQWPKSTQHNVGKLVKLSRRSLKYSCQVIRRQRNLEINRNPQSKETPHRDLLPHHKEWCLVGWLFMCPTAMGIGTWEINWRT